jgi:hypothetical protein
MNKAVDKYYTLAQCMTEKKIGLEKVLQGNDGGDGGMSQREDKVDTSSPPEKADTVGRSNDIKGSDSIERGEWLVHRG